MAHGFRDGTVLFITMQLALVAGAQAKTDHLRCEARTLRCESNFYDCLARCDRQMDAQPDKTTDAVQARHGRCESSCEERHGKRMTDIKAKPPCKDIEVTPNPRECEAHYLRVEASYMVCQSRCESRANPDKCQSVCTTRYETAVDELKVEPVCKNGRVKPTPTPESF